jgi:IS30 family transposase
MEPKCNRRDVSPGACNKCTKAKKCNLDKYFYDAESAEREYRRQLSESREGINLTPEQRESIGNTLSPLLNNGQSVHQALSAHPEIPVSERAIYNYIESGVFKEYKIDNFSLKEQVNRKQFKNKYKKRKEPANFNGRRYSDYLSFIDNNPGIPTTEMDTVYNSPHGPYIQTFLLEGTAFMFGFIHPDRTNVCMSEGINRIQNQLGPDLFSRLMSLILTDRGSEFEQHWLFEKDPEGNSRLNIFYCDPMQSSQKPHVENNHNYVRDIIPNGYPLDCLSQPDIELMFSHINSTPRRSLGDKSPYEVLCFLYNDDVPKCLNIAQIPRDEVILKPHLIFANKPHSK